MEAPSLEAVRPRAGRAAAIGGLVAAVMTLPGLGTGTLWDNSETAYGEIAREILLTHDAVVMHLNAYPWFIQPPLYFWLAALAAKLFGITSFALRLPSALAAIAAAAATAAVTARAAGERTGILAAAVLSTALMQAVIGRLAIMDALLDTAVTIAILAWFYAIDRGGRGRLPALAWVAGWAALGAGTLAKGFVAPVVAIAVVAGWFVWERRSRAREIAPALPGVLATLAGVAVFALIIVPWAILEYRAAGAEAFGEMIGHYTVGRYLGTIENQSGPVWYYVPVVILGFFPWIAYLLPSLRAAWEARGAASSLGRLSLVWSMLPLVFFSFAKTKLPNYVALELPGLAILVALWFDARAFDASRRTALAWTAVVPAAFLALLAAMAIFSSSNKLGPAFDAMKPDLFVFFGTNLAGSLICFALFTRHALARFAPIALATSTVLAWLYIGLVAEAHAEAFKPVPRLATIIDAQRLPNDTVSVQGVAGGNALLFYTRPHVHALVPFTAVPPTIGTDPYHAICTGSRAFVVGPKKRPALDPAFGRRRRVIAGDGNDVIVLYDGPPCSGPRPPHAFVASASERSVNAASAEPFGK